MLGIVRVSFSISLLRIRSELHFYSHTFRIHYGLQLDEEEEEAEATDFFPVDIVESNLLYHASRMLASASALSELLPRVIPS